MSSAKSKRRRQQSTHTKAAARAANPIGSEEARWVLVGLIALVIVAYSSVRHFGFLRFDDPQYVSENPHIAQGLTWGAISWALTAGYAANWHPLTWISHMLDVQLFGMDAGAHHVTNVLLHLASALLLFGVLLRMTGAVWRSGFVAGLFAVHPIHVESVAWVAERKDVLSALFWMLTLWAYVAYVHHRRLDRYLLVLALFALGLMAKPMLVTLPFALLLLDVWPLRRVSWVGGSETVRALVVEKLPLFALSLASSVITFLVQRAGGTVDAGGEPLVTRAENAMTAYVTYLGKTFWPSHLAAYYPYPKTFSPVLIAGSALLLAAVSGGAIRLARRHPYVPVGWFWYLGTLVPAIGLIQAGTQAMADRYTYIPLIGVSIIIAWGVPDLLSRWSLHKVAMAAVASAILVACAFASRAQVRYWQSDKALWMQALDVTTDNYAAHSYLANELAIEGNLDGAIVHNTEAIRIRPNFPEAHNNLGPVLARAGRLDEAVAQFTEAIRLRPGYPDAHSNLGLALASQGKLDEAVSHYQEAIRLNPDHARAHANLGVAYQALGRTTEAIQEFEIAVRLNPNNANVRRALAVLRNRQ